LARTKSASSTPRSKRADSVSDLKVLVTRLIAENKKLKTQIDKASSKASSTIAPRGLASLARKAERALAGNKPVKAVRKKPTTPRRPVSPETAEKRRQALAKARQAMADKRAEAARRTV
jgi:IS5 family transposase